MSRDAATLDQAYKATDAPARCITVVNGYDVAHFFLIVYERPDNLAVTLSITGSYGVYGHHWNAFGKRSLADALGGLSFDYAMNKLCPNGSFTIYDPDASVAAAKQQVIDYRRDGTWDKDEAREAWDAIHSADDTRSKDLFLQEMTEVFGQRFWDDELWSIARDRDNPQAVGLWTHMWPGFIAKLKEDQCARP